MEAKKPALNVAVSEDQVAAWKKKYDGVFVARTADGKVGYLRRPDRKILALAAVEGGRDNLKQKEIIINNCWLGGDEALKIQDKYFLVLAAVVDRMIEVVELTLEEA